MAHSTSVQNNLGEWVPAIAEPLHDTFGVRCDTWDAVLLKKCNKHFWTKKGYRGHYALIHILRLD